MSEDVISSEQPAQPVEGESADRRIIKRYSNRKLYDTKDSRYVTLLQIADMVRAGEDVQIIDNATKEDKTDVTLALIISEELKAKPRGIPLTTLKALIRNRGEKLLTTLREGPIGRLMPKEQVPATPAEPAQIVVEQVPAEPEAGLEDKEDDVSDSKDAKGLTRVIQTSRATLEQWQAAIDERINTVLPDFSPLKDLKSQLSKLNERLDKIEARLDSIDNKPQE
ncbi:MAG: polyhydroxyalkanoate synthesis regulator DNA-binding domain-containing protein [Polyangiaceae bacterium]|nr:polyhydroxyalkanoate synthesis regulator DNA-binding domain-containing protein [Polyangiaceae bacterium]MCB9607189.1 polyhydroxyalkanoate synthesis regulator DNA-binding domain-containing protein [Polyangiaceae bacterium]